MAMISIACFLLFFTRKKPLLTLHDTHLEAKLAPMAPLKMHKYCDIESIEQKGKVLMCYLKNSKKKFKIPLNFFDKSDAETIINSLTASTKQSES